MENIEVDKIEKKDNAKKKIILGSLIIVMSIMIIGISLSYAYFLNTVVEENAGNQGATITSGELTMNIATDKYITADAAMLINDADILTTDNYTSFSITLPDTAKVDEATYNIYLTEIKMTNNFKSSYVKWALYNANNEEVASGDFSNVTLSDTANGDGTYNGNDLAIKNSISITKGTTTAYKLYIWLSNDPIENQADLLDGSLSAKVGFRATTN